MKKVNLTRCEAIHVMANLLDMGNSIPYSSDGQGGIGFDMLDPDFPIDEVSAFWFKHNYHFRVVPASEISEEFKGNVDLDDYDVCVEFAKGSSRDQFLLWDIDDILPW